MLIDEPSRQKFAAAWSEGQPIDISECLPDPDSSQYLPTLEELVHIQLEFAWKAHAAGTAERPADVATLVTQFPALGDPRVLSQLLRQEFACRSDVDDSLSADEYRRQHPDLDLSQLTVPPGETVGPTAADDTKTLQPSALADEATLAPTPAPDEETIPPPPAAADPTKDKTIQAAIGEPRDGDTTPTDGVQLEGYEILGELGRGGMGVVYRARDIRLKRLVALKMVLAGAHASADELERFQREAEAVAQLQHPNIVQIHDVGEHDGHPYFSLEFVSGGGLDRHIAGEPQPPQQAAQLVETLSRAIQVAHDHNIIHRDLKPANVLLTADGEPKITDFGLAKQLEDDSAQTASGSIMGTPSYMAPEQAGAKDAQIGPTTDVYALGALLYCLLTGRPPFQSANVMDTVLQVLEQDPISPRQLVTGLDHDLETITLKCLRKEPERRYQSAEEVADELQRYLAGEPIEARPISAVERGWRWCRRKPAIAGLCTVVAALLVFVSVNGYLQAQTQRKLTIQALEQKAEAIEKEIEVKEQKTRAIKNFDLARGAVDRYMTEVSQNRLLTASQMEPLRRELLTGAMEFYEKFVEQSREDPELNAALGKSHLRLASILMTLGEPRKGIASLKRAIPVLKLAVASDPDNLELATTLLDAQHRLGGAYYQVAEFKSARKVYLETIDATKKMLKAHPENPNFIRKLGQIYNTLGYNDAALGDDDQAIESLREAISLLESNTQDQQDADVESLGNSYGNLATQLRILGRLDEAGEAFKKAIKLFSSLTVQKDGPAQVGHIFFLASIRTNYGMMLRSTGAIDDAELEFREAIRYVTIILKDSPDVVDYSVLLSGAYTSLGQLLSDSGRGEEAIATYETARKILLPLVAKHPNNPAFTHSLSIVYRAIGKFQAGNNRPEVAQPALKQAIDITEALVKQHPDVNEYNFVLANALGDMAGLVPMGSKQVEAEALYDRTLNILHGLLEKQPSSVDYHAAAARFQSNRGKARQLAGNLEGARSDFRSVIDRLNPRVAAHPEIVEFSELLAAGRSSLGSLSHNNKDFSAAVIEYRAAATIYRMMLKQRPGNASHTFLLARQLTDIAYSLEMSKKFQEAEPTYTESRKLLGQLTEADPNNRDFQEELARTEHHSGVLLVKTGNSAEGLNRMTAAATRLKSVIKSDPARLDIHSLLITVEIERAKVFINTKQPQQAMASFQVAINAGAAIHKAQPADADNLFMLIRLLSSLGSQQVKANQPQAAIGNYSLASERLDELIQQQPDRNQLLQILANNETTIAKLAKELDNLQDAISHQKLSVEARLKLAQKEPNNSQLIIYLANSHMSLAEFYDQAKRLTDAESSYRAAATLYSSLAKLDPAFKFIGNRVAISRLRIGELSLLRDHHADAVKMAVEVGQVKASHDPHGQRFKAATILARAVTLASRDPKLTPEQQTRFADQYRLAAMTMIKQLEDRKFFESSKNVKKFLDEQTFTTLENREDYKQLVDRLPAPDATKP